MNTMTEDCVLELTRIFDAPPERVFDAWLQKSWGEWAGPPGVRGEVVQMEPKVGGGYRIVMHRDSGDLSVSGTYKEIARPSRIKMTWKWDGEEPETLITLSFQPKGKGTELHMRHEGFINAARRDGHAAGWNGTFDKLERFLTA